MDYFRCKRFLDTLPDWEVGRPPPGPLEQYLPRVRALLERLGRPQERFRSVIVGGTNGKGTVSSLLAALLQGAGRRVGLYTSPHLHTQRERIRVNGQVLAKDQWAMAGAQLYDRTRDFEREGLGPFSKFEALTALAAHFFSQEGVEWGVFEVGLGGRYDATNAWDSEAAVLTSIGLDHVEVLGETVEEIARDKLHIARKGRPLFTTAGQVPQVMEVIRRTCAAQGIWLYVAGPERIEGPQALAYPWTPGKLEGRPCTYLENARLAMAMGAHLLGRELSLELARGLVQEHHWPGRFERAREKPLVLLDGAHNPAGAAALARDLKAIAPQWTMVIGAGQGHDAQGVLAALRPLARRVILTCSDHPRALEVEALARCAPPGLGVTQVPSWSRALRQALDELGEEGHLCVAGSLHLVARAREFFDLPHERDGITEDVALESLHCVRLACLKKGVACAPVSEDGNVLRVQGRRGPLFFLRNKHPFNDYVAGRLAEDKGYQYELFKGAGLPVPFTLQVFNPLADARFDRYKTHASLEEILAEVEEKFDFPLVAKKYRSSLAQGVFLEHSAQALERRLQMLFENSPFMDNIVLIQQYVRGPEYRIVASQGELLLAYGKVSERIDEKEDLNPLHQPGGRAVKVGDEELLEKMQELTRQVAGVIDLGFYAIDLIQGEEGFCILELNPNPFCYFYSRDHGRGDFVRVYQRLLEKYVL
jgi:dihydrofolate synthase/folylpolyglutamate synthase